MFEIPTKLLASDTPFFVIDEKRLRNNLSILTSLLPPQAEIYYSIKTNYEFPVLKTLAESGIGAEVSSGFELMLSLQAGFPPSKTILNGPAWKPEELKLAINHSIAMFNVDSLPMANLLNEISASQKYRAPVTIRINTSRKPQLGFLSKLNRKFGISSQEALDFINYSQNLKNISWEGLSTHTGTALSTPKPIIKAISILFELAHTLRSRGVKITRLNFGGGFPSPQSRSLTFFDHFRLEFGISPRRTKLDQPNLAKFFQPISQKIQKKLNHQKSFPYRIIFEPGRFIVGDAGILVTKILSIKDKWIFVDGGVNLIPESFLFIHRSFYLADRPFDQPSGLFNISGPTLNAADILGMKVPLPNPKIGDILIAENAGAYSLSRSNQFSQLRPAVYFIKTDGNIITCRSAETPEEYLENWRKNRTTEKSL